MYHLGDSMQEHYDPNTGQPIDWGLYDIQPTLIDTTTPLVTDPVTLPDLTVTVDRGFPVWGWLAIGLLVTLGLSKSSRGTRTWE